MDPRRLTPVAIVLLAVGCGQRRQDPGTGDRATIRAALSGSREESRISADMLAAARLVLQERGGRAGSVKVELADAEGYGKARAGEDHEGIARSAAAAVADEATVAWLGGLDSNDTAIALPLLNAGGVTAVSPSAAATPLTVPDPAFPGAPVKYFPDEGTYGRSFARTTANDVRVAAAATPEARRRGVRRIYAIDSGDTDGVAFGSAVERAAPAHGIVFVGHDSVAEGDGDWQAAVAEAIDAGADTIAWGSTSTAAADGLGRALMKAGPRMGLMLGPGADPRLGNTVFAAVDDVIAFDGAVPAGPVDPGFAGRFRKRWGHAPADGAVNAGWAMEVLLDAIEVASRSQGPEPGGESLRAAVAQALHHVARRTVKAPRMVATGDLLDGPVGEWEKTNGTMRFVRILG